MPSNIEELSGNNGMSEDSDNDNDGGSGGDVRDKRRDNAKQKKIQAATTR